MRNMRNIRTWRLLFVLTLTLALSVAASTSPPAAQAVGADVYTVNSSGQKVQSIHPFPIGNANPTCCCFGHNSGNLGYGVKVCYLPIP